MVIIFKATCALLIVAVGLLFRHLFRDWKQARATDVYIENTTPMDRLKYNAVFYMVSACLALIIIFFSYLLLCKVTISGPFE